MILSRQLAALKYGWIPRKPKLMARIAGFYLKSFVIGGRLPLRYVDYNITHGCNLACKFCFEKALRANGTPKLSIEQYRRIAQQALFEGVIHQSLQGGEPTLAPDLFEIIEALQPERCLISLTTNGTTMTEELARDLYEEGVDQLNVSVDSMIPAEHDRSRGKAGAYLETMAGIKTALRNGLHVQINCVVSHENVSSAGFEGLVRWCIQERFILNLVLAAPAGNWSGNRDVLLTESDMKIVRRIVRSSGGYVRHDSDAIKLEQGCPFGRDAIYVDPCGELFGCPFIQITFGNLRTEPLCVIRDRMLKQPWLKDRPRECLVAQDARFIDATMSQLWGRKDLPAKSEDIFP